MIGLASIGITYAPAIAEIELNVRDMAQVDTSRLESPVKPESEATNPAIEGVGSYYDYILPSGWSSVGHRVCATRDFPRYSYLRVTNIENGQSVICYVTDFGPDPDIHPDRIVDLSSEAFGLIADLKLGLINIKAELIN